MSHPLEGRSATLERGGGVLRGRGSRGEPSSEAEFVTRSRVDSLPSSEAELVQRALEGYPQARRRSFRGFEGDANGPHAVLL